MAVRNYFGFTYHCMTTAPMEEVAAAVNLRASRSSGIEFARKARIKHGGDAKEFAREKVLKLLAWEAWPQKVRMLTMPGLQWRFERCLMGRHVRLPRQEDGITASHRWTDVREMHCVEGDAAIYRASLKWMPGFRGEGFRVDTPSRMSSGSIASFDFCSIESYMMEPHCPDFDFAWLDFSGFLTAYRVETMRHFWEKRLTSCMVVTFMNARYGGDVKRKIAKFGSAANWLSNEFEADIADIHEYADPVAMVQVTFKKKKLAARASEKGE